MTGRTTGHPARAGHLHPWTLATVSAAAFLTCLDTRVGDNRAPGAAGLAARYAA